MYELKAFEQNPSSALFELTADLQWSKDSVAIDFNLAGAIDLLEVPEPLEDEPDFQDELWQTTCFEIFLQSSDSKAYEEWNFSTSGQWAHYNFETYRSLATKQRRLKPLKNIQVALIPLELRVCATIPLDLSQYSLTSPMHFGLSAILKLKSGEKQYWSLAHSAQKPDFHLASSFTGRWPE